MNIQQYYRSAANVSLNGSLVAFVPVILILGGGIYLSVELPLFLIILPFCLYSLICYQSYLIQHQRSLDAVITASENNRNLGATNNLLIAFLPAPSLRMLLFDSDGILIGEVRDEKFWWWRWFLPYSIDKLFPKKYGFYDKHNQVKAYYWINERKKMVKMYDGNRNEIGLFKQNKDSSSSLKSIGVLRSYSHNQDVYVEGSRIYPNLLVRNDKNMIIGKLMKGWMPKEWGKQFRDANTPFITFDENLNESEKILMIGILARFFHYTSH